MVTDLVSLVWHVCCVGHDSQEEDRSLQRQAGRHTATEPVLHNKILNRTSTPFRLLHVCHLWNSRFSWSLFGIRRRSRFKIYPIHQSLHQERYVKQPPPLVLSLIQYRISDSRSFRLCHRFVSGWPTKPPGRFYFAKWLPCLRSRETGPAIFWLGCHLLRPRFRQSQRQGWFNLIAIVSQNLNTSFH